MIWERNAEKVNEEELDILELEDNAADRRQFERRHLVIDIHFNGGDATGMATTRDIGLGGLYMATAADLREGTLLTMKIKLGERDIVLSGVVVYADPGHGVGVRFHNVSQEIEQILRNEMPLT